MRQTQLIYYLGQVTLSIVFIGSGLIPVLWSEMPNNLALLKDFPIDEKWHLSLFYSLVIMDLIAGLAVWVTPNKILWGLLISIVCLYTLMISLYAPFVWQDPFATLLKNFPILSWLVLMCFLENTKGK